MDKLEGLQEHKNADIYDKVRPALALVSIA